MKNFSNKVKFLTSFFSLMFFLSLSSYSQVYVKQGGTGAGTSWADAAGDLRAEISTAASGTDIWVAAGTYYPTAGSDRTIYFNLKNDVKIYGGFPNAGTPVWSDRDVALNITILSGDIGTIGVDTDNSYHVIHNDNNADNTAVLDGFTVTKGYADGSGTMRYGGGIYLRKSTPKINDCIITDNYSIRDGAGVYLTTDAAATFTACTITNNLADRYGGGFGLLNAKNAQITSNCVISNNTANSGGGIYMTNDSRPAITNCTITGNSSNGSGGGIFISSQSTTTIASNPSITNCMITNNTATLNGGGLYSDSKDWKATMSTCTIDGNIAKSGGGLYLSRAGATPSIAGCTISNNTAQASGTTMNAGYGGGIYINAAVPIISSNVIENNTARTIGTGNNCGKGGGVYITGSGTTTTRALISNNTIRGNTSQYGGAGIYMYRTNATITTNTIDANIVTAYQDDKGYGGGIYIIGDTDDGVSPEFLANTITNNQVLDGGFTNCGRGGGVYCTSDVTPVFTTNEISNNSAVIFGGGVYVADNAKPIFHRNVIHTNTAAEGGGFAIAENLSNAELYNNIIRTNTATLNGGGIYFSKVQLGTFKNNTIVGNIANTDGGGLFMTSNTDVTFSNTIIWGNTSGGGVLSLYIDDGNSEPFFSYSCVEGGVAGFGGGGATSYPAGNYTNCIEDDPLFADADYHLTMGTSPAVSKGDPGTVFPAIVNNEDYDGQDRFIGTIDMGAYEINNPPQFITIPYATYVDKPGPVGVTMDEDNAPITFTLNLYAHDLDDEDITWSILTAPTNGNAAVLGITSPPWTDASTEKAITYTVTTPDYNGTDMFVVEITDGILKDQITVDVTIDPVNDAPIINSTGIATIRATQVYAYTVTATDIDNVPADLIFSIESFTPSAWNTGPSIINNGDGTATVSGLPDDGDVGIYNITIKVTDNEIAPPVNFEEQTFTIEVEDRFLDVPSEFPTIQLAINAAIAGNTVRVADGTYNENIDFLGKEIEVIGNSATPANVTINGSGSGPVVTIENGEAGVTKLEGFTIKKGSGKNLVATNTIHAPSTAYYGGGIFIYQSSPLLKNIIVKDNKLLVNDGHGGSGAGIYIGNNSDVTIEGPNTVIENNTSTTYRGAGICSDDSDLTIDGTVAGGVQIINNSTGNYGGGMAITNTNLNLTNTTITGNSVSGLNARGADLYNHTSQVVTGAGVTITVRYNFE